MLSIERVIQITNFLIDNDPIHFPKDQWDSVNRYVMDLDRTANMVVLVNPALEDIIAFSEFEIVDDQLRCKTSVVGKKYERMDLLKAMLWEVYKVYPRLEYLIFERRIKYPNREIRIYPIKKFLHIKEEGGDQK